MRSYSVFYESSDCVLLVCGRQVRSAVRKRFHRWQEQHSIRARMTQAMSIPTSPSRVSFHSIKQSTSLWGREFSFVLVTCFWELSSFSATSLEYTETLSEPGQGSRARRRERLHQSPKPQEGHYTEFSREKGWGRGGRTLQTLWNERLVDQEKGVTKLDLCDLEFGCECTALHILSCLPSTAALRCFPACCTLFIFRYFTSVKTRSSWRWTALNWIPTQRTVCCHGSD